MNNGSQQDVPPYVAQGAPKVNFNVRDKKIIIPGEPSRDGAQAKRMPGFENENGTAEQPK
jgi:hypothetical protein